MATSPWLMTGVILVGITAALAAFYLYFNQPPRALTPGEAREAVRSGAFDVIIDVRSPSEWTIGHYHNAIHIPITELIHRLPHEVPDRESRILFYCRIGRRSSQAAAIATDLGYGHVSYLVGGDYTALEPLHTFHPN
jgi:rhodanese-related sulfurtransferase